MLLHAEGPSLESRDPFYIPLLELGYCAGIIVITFYDPSDFATFGMLYMKFTKNFESLSLTYLMCWLTSEQLDWG